LRRPLSPPPSATVQALVDMGFNRRAAEIAIAALGGRGEMTPSPESIVSWLLENPDQVQLGCPRKLFFDFRRKTEFFYKMHGISRNSAAFLL
jgi:hypothetical protein